MTKISKGDFLYFEPTMASIIDDITNAQDGTKDGTKTPRKRRAPTKIGGYTAVKKIGQGAMGDIWLCEDP